MEVHPNNWQFKTLQQLEKKDWGSPNDGDSFLVERCLQLTKIPLNEFTVEDLRIMIGQNFGLIYLVTLAMERLKENILAEGDFYPGDLLKNVANINEQFWADNEHLRKELMEIIKRNWQKLEGENISLGAFSIKN